MGGHSEPAEGTARARRKGGEVSGGLDVRLAHGLLQHRSASGQVRSTHQELAVELGTAREVVSRQLKELGRRGGVELHRGLDVGKSDRAIRATAGVGLAAWALLGINTCTRSAAKA